MLNNFIGGGQVFLHKVRMFKQVASTTFKVALLIGIGATVSLSPPIDLYLRIILCSIFFLVV